MQDLGNMERSALEALAARTLADAVGGDNRIAAYHMVMHSGESIANAAQQLGVSRKTVYVWIKGVERYLNMLRRQKML